MSTAITLLNLNETLTAKRAASRLNLSPERLQALITHGNFPEPDVNLGEPRWHVDTLDGWQAKQK